MNLKELLLYFWNDEICEHTNRKALKRILRANSLWHKGGYFSKLLAIYIHNRNIVKYGCEIYPQATIGEGLYIPHCVGIVVGNTTVIGKNCTIFPNVVFGAKYSPSQQSQPKRRHPIVGDNCMFGANASIIGNIIIGNNVTVGAGAIVTKDVPDNCTVVRDNIIIKK